MIQIDLMNSNNIVTLNSEGKLPIKSSSGFMFYSPNELLCVAIAACVGKHLVKWGSQNKVDLLSFEQLSVDMDKDEIQVVVQYPENVNSAEIRDLVENCDIAKKLAKPVKCITIVNDNLAEDVIKANTPTACCGG